MSRPVADHFSAQAYSYAHHRPDYPEELFTWLTELTPSRDLAWDSATGSGQAAAPLIRSFRRVIATDISLSQLVHRRAQREIGFAAARSEQPPLAPGTVDLIAVAQALHWLDLNTFYQQVRELSRPGGIFAAWCYGLFRGTPPIDRVIDHLYSEILGDYWPPERLHVETGYRSIACPFPTLSAPEFAMSHDWNLSQLLGYLDSWSAVRRYRQATARDPLSSVREDLLVAWEDPFATRTLRWPIHLPVCRLPG